MKRNLMIAILALITVGCATTSSSNIQPGKANLLKQAQTVYVQPFQSSRANVAGAVKNTIVEMLLASRLSVVTDPAKADIIINGTITFADDAIASGGAFNYKSTGTAHLSAGAGCYVSGITAHLIKGDDIVAATSVTQVRTDLWIPDPPEVMARMIGKRIRRLFS
jgi:PBP1b-binding outer membrane lipoprotein LpoB